jgi:hypothetical protein
MSSKLNIPLQNKTEITQRHNGRRHKSKATEKWWSQSQATNSLDLRTPCLAMQSAMQLLSRKIWEKVIELVAPSRAEHGVAATLD